VARESRLDAPSKPTPAAYVRIHRLVEPERGWKKAPGGDESVAARYSFSGLGAIQGSGRGPSARGPAFRYSALVLSKPGPQAR